MSCWWLSHVDGGGRVIVVAVSMTGVVIIQVVVIASSMGVAVVAMLVVVASSREVARQW